MASHSKPHTRRSQEPLIGRFRLWRSGGRGVTLWPLGMGSKVQRSGGGQRPRAAWGRLRALWERTRELWPVTLRGLGVAASTALALWVYGYGALDGVWYVAGVGLLGLCALCLVMVLAAAAYLKLRLSRRAPEPVERLFGETQRALATGFSVPRLRFWPLLDVQLEWLEPQHARVKGLREGPLLSEQVRPGDHGELNEVLRRVVVRDVFGLTSVALRRRAPLELLVLPHAGALRTLPLLRSLAGGDDVPHPLGLAQGDRLELRRYAPGDPARFIHWKAYARTQRLVVRMPERALARAHRVAAYLIAGERDAASAAAARVALEEGALGPEFCFGADGSPAPVRTVEEGLALVRRSSRFRDRSGAQLASYVEAVEREGPASYVLFVPPVLGPAIDHVRDMLKRRSHAVRVVIGIDGIGPQRAPSWLSRVALMDEGSSRMELGALREVMSAYQRLSCEVVVLDRESGRVLGDAHFAHAAAQARRGEAA